MKTCPYCASEVNPEEGSATASCSFCEMEVKPSEDGKRELQTKLKMAITPADINTPTKELMGWHTYDLLNLLKEVRTQKRELYGQFSKIVKENERTGNLQAEREVIGEDYDFLKKKTYAVENVLRDRMGYIPKKITQNLLVNMQQRVEEDWNHKPMQFYKPQEQERQPPPRQETTMER